MDKIYLVLECGYEYTEIIGVYDNKERAEEIKRIKEDWRIREYKVNQLTDEGKNSVLLFIEDLKEQAGVEEE